MKHPLALGSTPPPFTLTDEHGTRVALSDALGKKNVLLIFYPGDMTPVCTMQLCAIRDEWQKFQKAHIAVFGINHADAASHLLFTKKYHFQFPLLTDTGKKVSKAYGAIRTVHKQKVIQRSVIGIDLQGKIVYLKRGMPKHAELFKLFTSYAKH